MKSILTTLGKIWSWIIFSSANPDKISLTIRGLASMGVVQVVFNQVLPLLGFHPAFDLNTFADAIASVVYWAAMVISGLVGAIGALRKFSLTWQGKNPLAQ